MASKPVLIQLCKELDIDYEGMSRDKMAEAIKEEADKRFISDTPVSADNLSQGLKKFLMLEYDYVIRDKDKKELSWKD